MSNQNRPEWLLDFAANTYSQTGEDGIILKILSLLPERDNWCVEFGAWDGVYLCNTRNLIDRQYSAVLIEGSRKKFVELCNNYSGNPRVFPVNAFVGFNASDGLDSILAKYPIPADFDFLSIDIDGNDYHVWKAVEKYRPKLVCVEFNPTIPTEVSYIQPADPAVSHGNSLLAFTELAASKGYELVCVLPFNAFFVEKKYYSLFGITDNRPSTLRKDVSRVTWIYSGYDGSVHLSGMCRLPWHGIRIKEKRVQVLPAYFRRFPGNFSKLQKALFSLLCRIGWFSRSRN